MKKGHVRVDYTNLPEHIAFIMDGNGRWAQKRFLTRGAGHKAGAETLRKLAERMNAAGFKMMTVYAFSTENWNRPEEEVRGLLSMLSDYIQQYIDDSKKNNMRIAVIGDITRLDKPLQERITYLQELTREHQGMRVNIAINYGGRDEIVRAVRKIAEDAVKGVISPRDISADIISSNLDTRDMPDPELIIRTSGEIRLSNFMLWQVSYSEIYVCPKLWPDFSYDDLLEAVCAFQSRDRRFGRADVV